MNIKIPQHRIKQAQQLILPIIAIIITLSIMQYPEEAFDAAKQGLNVWFNIVLPALLPFYIGSQLLMGLGVVHFMGVLLEPVMRPIFNVPGSGSFVMAMGLASGYPIGAMLTGKMVKQGFINTWEGERLVSFSNTSDTLFMIGAVGVGMLKDARLGAIIALAHYISALALGVIMRFYAANRPQTPAPAAARKREGVFIKGVRELLKARKEDGRPIGQLLADCVMDSINSQLLVLGFMILFSVVIRIIIETGIIAAITPVIEIILSIFGIDKGLAPALVGGFFEITMGTQMVSQVNASIVEKMVLISAIIAWSGLSVHFQVLSMLVGSGVKMVPYILARMLHAVLAGITTYILMMLPGNRFDALIVPAFAAAPEAGYQGWVHLFKTSSTLFILLFLLLLFGTVFFSIVKGLDVFGFKVVKK